MLYSHLPLDAASLVRRPQHIERSKLSREPPGEGVSTGHVLPGGVAGVDPGEKISQLVNAFTFAQISCWRWREGSVYYQIVLYIISPK